jgi:tetratricopeptide (TPR) repeat protein
MPDAAAVAAYLAAAPPAVREWLLAQAVSGPSLDRDDPAPATVDVERDALDELDEEDDDVIGARLHARARSHPSRTSRWARTALVAAVALGAGFGIWFAGLDNHSAPDAAGNPSLAAGNPDEDGDTAAYIAELRDTVDAEPSDIDARLKLGAALFNVSDLDGAKEQWDAVLALDPDQAIAWYNLGFFHMSSDPPDWDAVRASWQKVLEIDPTSSMAATVQTHLDGLQAANS